MVGTSFKMDKVRAMVARLPRRGPLKNEPLHLKVLVVLDTVVVVDVTVVVVVVKDVEVAVVVDVVSVVVVVDIVVVVLVIEVVLTDVDVADVDVVLHPPSAK